MRRLGRSAPDPDTAALPSRIASPSCSPGPAQVFHVPLEERKYKDMNQFGEGEQAKICLEIMQRTGAHLELSLAKDQGLSIMVSGKLDAVMKARKDIVARLQTQVGGRRPRPQLPPTLPSEARPWSARQQHLGSPGIFGGNLLVQ